jgi:hypothetical protein
MLAVLGVCSRSRTMVGSRPISDRVQPQDGDVVVLLRSRPGRAWSVLRHPGPAQIAAESCQEAIVIARSVATELGVDVWSLDAGAYRILETHRRRERTPHRSRAARGV